MTVTNFTLIGPRNGDVKNSAISSDLTTTNTTTATNVATSSNANAIETSSSLIINESIEIPIETNSNNNTIINDEESDHLLSSSPVLIEKKKQKKTVDKKIYSVLLEMSATSTNNDTSTTSTNNNTSVCERRTRTGSRGVDNSSNDYPLLETQEDSTDICELNNLDNNTAVIVDNNNDDNNDIVNSSEAELTPIPYFQLNNLENVLTSRPWTMDFRAESTFGSAFQLAMRHLRANQDLTEPTVVRFKNKILHPAFRTMLDDAAIDTWHDYTIQTSIYRYCLDVLEWIAIRLTSEDEILLRILILCLEPNSAFHKWCERYAFRCRYLVKQPLLQCDFNGKSHPNLTVQDKILFYPQLAKEPIYATYDTENSKRYVCLVDFLNRFGHCGGFHHLLNYFQSSQQQPLQLQPQQQQQQQQNNSHQMEVFACLLKPFCSLPNRLLKLSVYYKYLLPCVNHLLHAFENTDKEVIDRMLKVETGLRLMDCHLFELVENCEMSRLYFNSDFFLPTIENGSIGCCSNPTITTSAAIVNTTTTASFAGDNSKDIIEQQHSNDLMMTIVMNEENIATLSFDTWCRVQKVRISHYISLLKMDSFTWKMLGLNELYSLLELVNNRCYRMPCRRQHINFISELLLNESFAKSLNLSNSCLIYEVIQPSQFHHAQFVDRLQPILRLLLCQFIPQTTGETMGINLISLLWNTVKPGVNKHSAIVNNGLHLLVCIFQDLAKDLAIGLLNCVHHYLTTEFGSLVLTTPSITAISATTTTTDQQLPPQQYSSKDYLEQEQMKRELARLCQFLKELALSVGDDAHAKDSISKILSMLWEINQQYNSMIYFMDILSKLSNQFRNLFCLMWLQDLTIYLADKSSGDEDEDKILTRWNINFPHSALSNRTVPSIKLFISICKLWPILDDDLPLVSSEMNNSDEVPRHVVMQQLIEPYDLCDRVCSSLSYYMKAARCLLKEMPSGSQLSTIKVDGCHSHLTQLSERLRLIRFLLREAQMPISKHLCEHLWNALIVNSIQPDDDHRLGFQCFIKLLKHGILSPEIAYNFFTSHVMAMDPKNINEEAMRCFDAFFRYVNQSRVFADLRSPFAQTGQDYLWAVLQKCIHNEVAHQAITILKDFYVHPCFLRRGESSDEDQEEETVLTEDDLYMPSVIDHDSNTSSSEINSIPDDQRILIWRQRRAEEFLERSLQLASALSSTLDTLLQQKTTNPGDDNLTQEMNNIQLRLTRVMQLLYAFVYESEAQYSCPLRVTKPLALSSLGATSPLIVVHHLRDKNNLASLCIQPYPPGTKYPQFNDQLLSSSSSSSTSYLPPASLINSMTDILFSSPSTSSSASSSSINFNSMCFKDTTIVSTFTTLGDLRQLSCLQFLRKLDLIYNDWEKCLKNYRKTIEENPTIANNLQPFWLKPWHELLHELWHPEYFQLHWDSHAIPLTNSQIKSPTMTTTLLQNVRGALLSPNDDHYRLTKVIPNFIDNLTNGVIHATYDLDAIFLAHRYSERQARVRLANGLYLSRNEALLPSVRLAFEPAISQHISVVSPSAFLHQQSLPSFHNFLFHVGDLALSEQIQSAHLFHLVRKLLNLLPPDRQLDITLRNYILKGSCSLSHTSINNSTMESPLTLKSYLLQSLLWSTSPTRKWYISKLLRSILLPNPCAIVQAFFMLDSSEICLRLAGTAATTSITTTTTCSKSKLITNSHSLTSLHEVILRDTAQLLAHFVYYDGLHALTQWIIAQQEYFPTHPNNVLSRHSNLERQNRRRLWLNILPIWSASLVVRRYAIINECPNNPMTQTANGNNPFEYFLQRLRNCKRKNWIEHNNYATWEMICQMAYRIANEKAQLINNIHWKNTFYKLPTELMVSLLRLVWSCAFLCHESPMDRYYSYTLAKSCDSDKSAGLNGLRGSLESFVFNNNLFDVNDVKIPDLRKDEYSWHDLSLLAWQGILLTTWLGRYEGVSSRQFYFLTKYKRNSSSSATLLNNNLYEMKQNSLSKSSPCLTITSETENELTSATCQSSSSSLLLRINDSQFGSQWWLSVMNRSGQQFIIDTLLLSCKPSLQDQALHHLTMLTELCLGAEEYSLCHYWFTVIYLTLQKVVPRVSHHSEYVFQFLESLLKLTFEWNKPRKKMIALFNSEKQWLLTQNKIFQESGFAVRPLPKLFHGHLLLTKLLWRGCQDPYPDQSEFIEILLRDFLYTTSFAYMSSSSSTISPTSDSSLNTQFLKEPFANSPDSEVMVIEVLLDIAYQPKELYTVFSWLYQIFYEIRGHDNSVSELDRLRPSSIPPLASSCQRFLGLKNAGATCYMNSVLQQFFMLQPIREFILSIPLEEIASSDKFLRNMEREFGHSKPLQPLSYNINILSHLQNTFAHLLVSKMQYFAPEHIWDNFLWGKEKINVREQHDALEFYNLLTDTLDEGLSSLGLPKLIDTVMGGSFADQKLCLDCPHRFQREEGFTSMQIDQRNQNHLIGALQQYVLGERLEGDNAYACETCGTKVSAIKRLCIQRLPPILLFQLKRFDFDWDRNTAVKYNDYFEFPWEVDMRPFTAEYLTSVDDMDNSSGTESALPVYHNEVSRYCLRGVVVHSGQANGGHYYSFVLYCGRWYKFDDTEVSEWLPIEASNAWYGGLQEQEMYDIHQKRNIMRRNQRWWNAYILLYEREDFATAPEWSNKLFTPLTKMWSLFNNTNVKPPNWENAFGHCLNKKSNNFSASSSLSSSSLSTTTTITPTSASPSTLSANDMIGIRLSDCAHVSTSTQLRLPGDMVKHLQEFNHAYLHCVTYASQEFNELHLRLARSLERIMRSDMGLQDDWRFTSAVGMRELSYYVYCTLTQNSKVLRQEMNTWSQLLTSILQCSSFARLELASLFLSKAHKWTLLPFSLLVEGLLTAGDLEIRVLTRDLVMALIRYSMNDFIPHDNKLLMEELNYWPEHILPNNIFNDFQFEYWPNNVVSHLSTISGVILNSLLKCAFHPDIISHVRYSIAWADIWCHLSKSSYSQHIILLLQLHAPFILLKHFLHLDSTYLRHQQVETFRLVVALIHLLPCYDTSAYYAVDNEASDEDDQQDNNYLTTKQDKTNPFVRKIIHPLCHIEKDNEIIFLPIIKLPTLIGTFIYDDVGNNGDNVQKNTMDSTTSTATTGSGGYASELNNYTTTPFFSVRHHHAYRVEFIIRLLNDDHIATFEHNEFLQLIEFLKWYCYENAKVSRHIMEHLCRSITHTYKQTIIRFVQLVQELLLLDDNNRLMRFRIVFAQDPDILYMAVNHIANNQRRSYCIVKYVLLSLLKTDEYYKQQQQQQLSSADDSNEFSMVNLIQILRSTYFGKYNQWQELKRLVNLLGHHYLLPLPCDYESNNSMPDNMPMEYHSNEIFSSSHSLNNRLYRTPSAIDLIDRAQELILHYDSLTEPDEIISPQTSNPPSHDATEAVIGPQSPNHNSEGQCHIIDFDKTPRLLSKVMDSNTEDNGLIKMSASKTISTKLTKTSATGTNDDDIYDDDDDDDDCLTRVMKSTQKKVQFDNDEPITISVKLPPDPATDYDNFTSALYSWPIGSKAGCDDDSDEEFDNRPDPSPNGSSSDSNSSTEDITHKIRNIQGFFKSEGI